MTVDTVLRGILMLLALIPIFWIVYDEKKYPKYSWRYWLSVVSLVYLAFWGLLVFAVTCLLGMAVLHAFSWLGLGLLMLLTVFSLAFLRFWWKFFKLVKGRV